MARNVKVKPAAKQTGNPFNTAKSREAMLSSASRGGVGKGPLGKAVDARKVTGITGQGKPPVNKPSRTPDTPAKTTVKINSKITKSDPNAKNSKRATAAANKDVVRKPMPKTSKLLGTKIAGQPKQVSKARAARIRGGMRGGGMGGGGLMNRNNR